MKLSDVLLVFCEDSHMRSIKTKVDKIIQEDSLQHRRIDIINHDVVLLNLYHNAHSPQYTLTSIEELLFV